jgi:leucyl aminopeptidase
MSKALDVKLAELDLTDLSSFDGRIVAIVSSDGTLDQIGRKLNKISKGSLARLVSSDKFEKMKLSDVTTLAFPVGLDAVAIDVVKLDRRADAQQARKAGAKAAGARGQEDVIILAGLLKNTTDFAQGYALRLYDFLAHKTNADGADDAKHVTVMAVKPEDHRASFDTAISIVEGVNFTRDLVNEPANILTTTEFATRLQGLSALGIEVEILDEAALKDLGMGALLGVGQGSASPSKIVVMQWNGGEKGQNPFALVGKGVCFDTGGISLKPAAGMEDMTSDMGGAAVVAGTMMSLAKRKAKANVVGLVGLVENMPSSTAQRPGDVVTSMKGDTIEVINTDAEGRLVLCDVMWYAQERFNPTGMIDLATLTGAIIIGLGHENAGVFSNDDTLCNALLGAAKAEDEGAWRMPLGDAYDALLKSRIADMKNIGGRPAGSITAAQFLQRFVKPQTPWIHLDIAGVCQTPGASTYSASRASGWGVRTLNRLVSDIIEAD